MASGASQGHGPSTYSKMPSPSLSHSSSSNPRLTPDANSDSDSDLEMEEGGESYKMTSRAGRAAGDDEDEEEEDEDDREKYGRRRRGTSISTVQSFQLYTPDEERAVVRKFDRRLVLFVALLYMLSFLDRSSKVINPLYSRSSTDIRRYWKCEDSRPRGGPPSRLG
jgi:hypothetical protein